MSSEKTFIAVDLGAGSGRVIAAKTDFSRLELEEIHRFDNPGTDLPGGSFWNITCLYREIFEGLRRAVERHAEKDGTAETGKAVNPASRGLQACHGTGFHARATASRVTCTTLWLRTHSIAGAISSYSWFHIGHGAGSRLRT